MEQYLELIPMSILGIAIFVVFRLFNSEGNPNRGGFGGIVYMMGVSVLSMVIFICGRALVDIMYPSLAKENEWIAAGIPFVIALLVFFSVSLLDKNSDIYYKQLGKKHTI